MRPQQAGPSTSHPPSHHHGKALPWRAARRGWDAAGVDFAYDLWEGGYPDLLRTRRLVRRTAVLSSTAASSAAAALALLARESRTGPSGGGDSSNTVL